MSAEFFQVHFKSYLIIEVNTLNPDQTAWEQSDLGPYCLRYMQNKNSSRREMQMKLS